MRASSATFAIITVALISGAIADRAKFGAWPLFTPIWVTLVYAPLALWVWGGGLLAPRPIGSWAGEAIDFAGGTVVHINAGVAGLVLALILGVRRALARTRAMRPHNIPFVMLGAALLWFGWFGFNGGARPAPPRRPADLDQHHGRPGAAMLAWFLTERIRDGHPTSLGAASGIVAGWSPSPRPAERRPDGAIALGIVAGVVPPWPSA